jgi:hypothetical protein
MLTNAAILEYLVFLLKADKGKYVLGDNAKEQVVFLYGDALTVNLHESLYDQILRKIPQLGNREYVEMLLMV